VLAKLSVPHCLIGCRVPVRPPGGGSPPGWPSRESDRPSPLPLLHLLPPSPLLPRTNPLLLSPPQREGSPPSPPGRLLRIIRSLLCGGECSFAPVYWFPPRPQLNPSSSVPLWSLLGSVWGQEQVYASINGVKFHSGHVALLLEILGLAAVKSFLFLGARDGETAIYCSQLAPGSIRNRFSVDLCFSFVGLPLCWPRPLFLA
jgi:hypothetical protein